MKIALINIPLKEPLNSKEWIPLPPKGYGGIQWVVTNLLDGYLKLGHSVWLLGAPSTALSHRNLTVVKAAEPDEIYSWLKTNIIALKINVIHDNSNGVFLKEECNFDCPIVTTHHLTGKPKKAAYPIYLSHAQRELAGDLTAPVIRIPVNPNRYIYSEDKKDYLLYLGRVSSWKGTLQAAQFAHLVGMKLLVGGPTWEKSYVDEITASYSENIEFIGEVGGNRRIQLLSDAKALLAFSQTIQGPWGDLWCEPGSTVVSEAAVSGTPVIATTNGCLKEIVPYVGLTIDESSQLTSDLCMNTLSHLPCSEIVFKNCIKNWHYLRIATEYLEYFQLVSGVNDIRAEDLSSVNSITKELLIEGGIVVPSVLNRTTLEKVDQLTKNWIQSWEKNLDVDPDFWWYRDETMGKNILYRIHHLETKDPAIEELYEHPRVKKLRDLIFGKPTRVTACALIYKAPLGSASVPWHRDPIETPPNTVYNFSIYLDSSDQSNGALEVMAGSHLNKKIPSPDELQKTKTLNAQPGDIAIHDVCVYHGSRATHSEKMRRSIVIEFQIDTHSNTSQISTISSTSANFSIESEEKQ